MSDAPDPGRDLSVLRDEGPPDVVKGAFRRFKRRLAVAGAALALVVGGVTYYFAGIRAGSDIPSLEAQVGEENGPFQLIAQDRIGDEDWKVYAFRDQAGRPCLIGTLGGGGCYQYAGLVRGEIGDYRASGGSWVEENGDEFEYLVVKGTVPRDVEEVEIELTDGTVERTETVLVPEFAERFFAVLIDEGSSLRSIEEVRDVSPNPRTPRGR
jgi:hypothetical protein